MDCHLCDKFRSKEDAEATTGANTLHYQNQDYDFTTCECACSHKKPQKLSTGMQAVAAKINSM